MQEGELDVTAGRVYVKGARVKVIEVAVAGCSNEHHRQEGVLVHAQVEVIKVVWGSNGHHRQEWVSVGISFQIPAEPDPLDGSQQWEHGMEQQ